MGMSEILCVVWAGEGVCCGEGLHSLLYGLVKPPPPSRDEGGGDWGVVTSCFNVALPRWGRPSMFRHKNVNMLQVMLTDT